MRNMFSFTPALVTMATLIFACNQNTAHTQAGALSDTMTQTHARNATPDTPLDSLLKPYGEKQAQIWLYIDKSERILQVKIDTDIIKTYPVVLGGNPTGDKRMEGDQKTPEGVFQLRNLYPHARWSKFMWVDYPTAESWEKHNQAKEDGTIPKDASIGGEIGIHGVPEGMDALIDEGQDWTLGCISLKNAHIDELYAVCKKGTKIEIVP
jgi:murein L,D-transpeptidase YafK